MRTILLGTLTSLSFATAAHASTWHVDPNGNDGSAGSLSAPWRTIQHAADRVIPGDTVIIHAGTYTGFQIGAQGTQASPIAFVGDGAVLIDGAATSDRDAVHIEGAAWVRVEGLTVTHAARAGISALDCDHITVRNNRVDSNGKWGVFTAFCENLVVDGNEASRSGTQHGIYASNSADHPVIRNNKIWGNAMCGIHMNGDISQGGDGVISGALVENNVITDNGRLGCSGINGDGITGAVIRNNVLDGNHASGISLYDIDGGAPSSNNLVVNNTIRMASDARWAINIQDGSTGNVLRNNILLDPSPSSGAIDVCATCTTGTLSDHNAVVGRFSIDGGVVDLVTWRTRTGNDLTSFVATEAQLFMNPAIGDLSLRDGSPGIDQGLATDTPLLDILGTPRPQGAEIDIGAYEHCTGACVTGGGSGSGSDDPGGGGSGSGSGNGNGSDYSGPLAPGQTGGCSVGDPDVGVLAGLGLGALVIARRRRGRGSKSSAYAAG